MIKYESKVLMCVLLMIISFILSFYLFTIIGNEIPTNKSTLLILVDIELIYIFYRNLKKII